MANVRQKHSLIQVTKENSTKHQTTVLSHCTHISIEINGSNRFLFRSHGRDPLGMIPMEFSTQQCHAAQSASALPQWFHLHLKFNLAVVPKSAYSRHRTSKAHPLDLRSLQSDLPFTNWNQNFFNHGTDPCPFQL